jgi:flavin-dependent dehydrogenase
VDADVAVVGGGPAGCALAIALLRDGVSCVVIEKSGYEHPRPGEGLPPEARPLLQVLGVWADVSAGVHRPSFGTRSWWGGERPSSRDFLFNPYGSGWHLDRRRFDAQLAQAAQRAGARLLTGVRVAEVERRPGSWRLGLRGAGVLDVRFVVDATGRAAAFATRQGARRIAAEPLLAAHVLLGPRADDSEEERTWVEAVPDGWWYSAPVPGGMAACFVSDPALMRGLRVHLLDGLLAAVRAAPRTAGRIGGRALRGRVRLAAAGSARLDRLAGDGWLAVGDAGVAHDPLSSAGIVSALQSGLSGAAAIRALWAGQPHEAAGHESSVLDRFEAYQRERVRYYALERRWPQAPFWLRRRSRSGPWYALATSGCGDSTCTQQRPSA